MFPKHSLTASSPTCSVPIGSLKWLAMFVAQRSSPLAPRTPLAGLVTRSSVNPVSHDTCSHLDIGRQYPLSQSGSRGFDSVQPLYLSEYLTNL